ncbi:MAG: alpha/beta hydrolase [Proteobacteria bacterium]|nr:MAG: alpha/beta hydrolase [Pseudomonadota bacterium]
MFAHRSGDQPRLDAVEAARGETGVALEAGRVDVGDVSLHVVQAGPADGPLVVLLHGFPEFWYAWRDVIPPLAQAGFRVAAPDQRGYGDSDKLRDVEAYRVDRLGDDVAGLIAALGRERAFVVAHDWGGGVAWNVAIRHPARVAKLAVLDTPHPDVEHVLPQTNEKRISWYRTFFQIPFVPEETARWGDWYLLAKSLRDSSKPGAFSDEKLALYRSAWDRDGAFGTMVNWYRAAYRFRAEPAAPRRVAVPTAILVAANDAFIPGDLTRASVQLCDDAKLVELGSGTHWIVQEEPARVAAELVAFFRE